MVACLPLGHEGEQQREIRGMQLLGSQYKRKWQETLAEIEELASDVLFALLTRLLLGSGHNFFTTSGTAKGPFLLRLKNQLQSTVATLWTWHRFANSLPHGHDTATTELHEMASTSE